MGDGERINQSIIMVFSLYEKEYLPITGYFNGNAIAITVNFPHCKQVVAMTGNTTNDQGEIHTLWLDATQAKDPTGQDWNSNIVGADSYKKIG